MIAVIPFKNKRNYKNKINVCHVCKVHAHITHKYTQTPIGPDVYLINPPPPPPKKNLQETANYSSRLYKKCVSSNAII